MICSADPRPRAPSRPAPCESSRCESSRSRTDARLAGPTGELTKRLQHPTVGATSVTHQAWLQPDSPDHRLEAYTPNNPSPADALHTLPHQSRPNPHRTQQPKPATPSNT